jgi:SAM-dependent methyltransferase
MDHFHDFYERRGEEYARLVAAEDADGELAGAVVGLVGDGDEVLEVGVGTGRLTALLAHAGARVVGCEPAASMLAVAGRALDGLPVTLHACGLEGLEIPPASFDLAVAGWVFGHFTDWLAGEWRARLAVALDRLDAGLRPGGRVVLFETLGSGVESPAPPTPGLAEYTAWLEGERGFTRRLLRTDYVFASVAEAAEVTGAFFGADFAARVRERGWARVPEWTWMWSGRRKEEGTTAS